MKILKTAELKPLKHGKSKHTKSTMSLRKTDWEILMKHDPSSDELDIRSKEVIRDPASVKRLLEAEMIDPFGKLTSRAREKCKALAQKLDNSLLALSPNPPRHDEGAAPLPARQKIGKITPFVWDVLMKYDRQTGNLLRVDPETGLLDDCSRAILKKPSLIQLLIDKKLIQSGGWLTPKAKEGCARLEKKLIVKPSWGTPVPQSKRPRNCRMK